MALPEIHGAGVAQELLGDDLIGIGMSLIAVSRREPEIEVVAR